MEEYEYYLKRVKEYGLELEDIPEDIIDEKMCIEAVRQDSFAIEFVPKNLQRRITSLMKNNWKEPKTKPKINHKDEETKILELSCCVCMTNKRCTLFKTCNHIPVCFSCSKNLNGKCPLCRLENQKTKVVFN